MKKETKGTTTIYESVVSKKLLEEVVLDILKSYQQGKKLKVSVSV